MFKKKEKMTLKKSTVIIIEVCVGLVVLLAALGIKYLVTNKADDSIRFSDQVVSGITFSDFTIKKDEDNNNVITVNAINYSEESLDLERITVMLLTEDNIKVSEINFDFGYKLDKNQQIELMNTIAMDLSGVASVEYEVKLK